MSRVISPTILEVRGTPNMAWNKPETNMQPGLRVCLEAQGAQQSRHRTRWKVTNATIRNQLYNLNGLGQLQGYVWHLPATCMRNSSSPQDHIQCPVSLYNEVPSLSCKWWFCASGVLLDSRLRIVGVAVCESLQVAESRFKHAELRRWSRWTSPPLL